MKTFDEAFEVVSKKIMIVEDGEPTEEKIEEAQRILEERATDIRLGGRDTKDNQLAMSMMIEYVKQTMVKISVLGTLGVNPKDVLLGEFITMFEIGKAVGMEMERNSLGEEILK